MSGWLPPGVTDKDIDDAANGDGSLLQCDNCGKLWLRESMLFVSYRHPDGGSGEMIICPDCRGENDDEDDHND